MINEIDGEASAGVQYEAALAYALQCFKGIHEAGGEVYPDDLCCPFQLQVNALNRLFCLCNDIVDKRELQLQQNAQNNRTQASHRYTKMSNAWIEIRTALLNACVKFAPPLRQNN